MTHTAAGQPESRNQKIIDALVQKAHRHCPGSLALVGIYGSFQTGDYHEKSDLDLLVLINDDSGWQLGCAFLQEDQQIGHDIYCTTWRDLERDAEYTHPNISKLMDSRIVYCQDSSCLTRLENLRQKAARIMAAPFSQEDLSKAETHLRSAGYSYAQAMASSDLTEIRCHVGHVLWGIQNAVAMLNKTYYRFGTKRVFQEIAAMAFKPVHFQAQTDAILRTDSPEQINSLLTTLMSEVFQVFHAAESTLISARNPVSADALRGTYEEMFSNWRNKLHMAAVTDDRHLAFSSLCAMNDMLGEIRCDSDIGSYNAIACYDPSDLFKTERACDELLESYLQEYRKAGLLPKCYRDIDAFVEDYL